MVTTCGHYFCSSCALEHNKKDPTCPACGEKTGRLVGGARPPSLPSSLPPSLLPLYVSAFEHQTVEEVLKRRGLILFFPPSLLPSLPSVGGVFNFAAKL